MKEGASVQEVGDEAARWVARVDSRPLGRQAKAELKEWLARDDRHRGAFFRALAIWQSVGQESVIDDEVWSLLHPSGQLSEETSDTTVPAAEGKHRAPKAAIGRRRVLLAGATLAASLLPVAFLTGFLPSISSADDSRRITTLVGERAEVPLRDGSLVVVNTGTQLEVEQSSSLRKVRLAHGEAWFHVAKDASRPFVVSAGNVRVRAVGTAFSVRRRGHGADVQVTEGVVEVWSEARAGWRPKVSAGTRTFVSDQVGAQELENDAADIERELSWREGVLTFAGKTLSQAAEEFNRYNLTQIRIDPALADEKVVGRFNPNEPDAFAAVVSRAFGAAVEKERGQIHIEKK